MEEALENGKESSHSAHGNGMNENISKYSLDAQQQKCLSTRH